MHSGPQGEEGPRTMGRDPLPLAEPAMKPPQSRGAEKEPREPLAWFPAHPSAITGNCGTAPQWPDCKKNIHCHQLYCIYVSRMVFLRVTGCRRAQSH